MKILQALLILSLCSLHCSENKSKEVVQQAKPPSAPKVVTPVFDGDRAFLKLKAQTDIGPRYPGSPGQRKCLEFLQSELRQYADAVNLQPFTHIGYENQTLNMWNVIASFNSSSPTRILLMAHWDTRPYADQDSNPANRNRPILGANDGASGVAVLLEIARLLKSSPPNIGVDIVLVDGEDYGKKTIDYLLGSKFFASNLPPGYRPIFGIVVDMIGDAQLEIARETNSLQYAPDIVELVWSTARSLDVTQFVEKVQPPVTDDHLPLNQAGIKAIDLIDFDYPDDSNRFWHTLQDTPDKCSPQSLEAVGKVLLHVIYQYPA